MGAERRCMKCNPDVHHRKNIRLKEYDYSKEGMYFITICTKDRERLFGNIINRKMKLNEYGKMVEEEIINTNKIRQNVRIGEYIIMPNHVHMIIEIIDVGVAWYATQGKVERSKMIIPKIIQQIKTITIKKANRINESGLHTMQPLQWQRNYYEHIIRNEKELYRIIEYIKYNPLNWENDSNYKI